MQTILGAGGAIGNALAQHLPAYTNRVRLVSRNPKAVTGTEELLSADLTDAAAVQRAVAGSEVVYLVAGLPYRLKTWQEQWPVVMRNVLDACAANGARLVFFDNVYAYANAAIPHMTEEAAIAPPSKKGVVRAEILQLFWDRVQAGGLQGQVVRAADFYGPGISNSMLLETVFKNLKKGKAAYWLGDPGRIHSFTYTPDAGKATALLGNTADAWQQTWHLPTSPEKLTGHDWVQLFANTMGVKAKTSVVSKTMMRLLGLFNPFMREAAEMMYQNTQDYFFDSSKFQKRFSDFRVTSYREGVQEIVNVG